MKWICEHKLFVCGLFGFALFYVGLRNYWPLLTCFGLKPLDHSHHGTIGDAFAPITALLAFTAFYIAQKEAKHEGEHRKAVLDAQVNLVKAQEGLVDAFRKSAVITARASIEQEKREAVRSAAEYFRELSKALEEVEKSSARIVRDPAAELPEIVTILPVGLPQELDIEILRFQKAIGKAQGQLILLASKIQRGGAVDASVLNAEIDKAREAAFDAREAIQTYRYGRAMSEGR